MFDKKYFKRKLNNTLLDQAPSSTFLKIALVVLPPFLSRCQKRYCVTSAFASCCGVLNVCLYVECNFLGVKIWKASLILVTIGNLRVGNLTVWGWRRET